MHGSYQQQKACIRFVPEVSEGSLEVASSNRSADNRNVPDVRLCDFARHFATEMAKVRGEVPSDQRFRVGSKIHVGVGINGSASTLCR